MSQPLQLKRRTGDRPTKHPGYSQEKRTSLFEHRLRYFRGVIFILAIVLIGRLFQISVTEGAKWTALAENQHIYSRALAAGRGDILLRDGDGTSPLAVSREYQMAYMVPGKIKDISQTVITLASVLSLDEEELRTRIESRRDDPFEILKRRLTPDEVNRLRELALPGIYFLPEIARYYPAGELASKVIGFASPGEEGDLGVYGIEASFHGELKGKDGKLLQEKDAAGRWIPLSDREHVEAVDGESIVLTLDRVIQYEVEQILKEALEKHSADQVSAIVMEPKTGKILAMAALPQFNPNEYGKVEDLGLFLNPLISLPYESGSVMKPITMAIGIEEGKVAPQTEFVDTGSIVEAGYVIKNAEGKVYGRSSMERVLNESINTGVMYIERQVGNVTFRDYLERFGFGTRTGIRLPAEHPGNLKNLAKDKATIEFLTASFGQGITVTPLQLVNAYATLANGGVLMKPEIIDRTIKADGTIVPQQPKEIRRVISQETSQMIGAMLRKVVTEGHGKRADVPGYLVVGKTGTAQVAKTGSRGYEEGLTIGSFAGYAPLNDPRYAVIVKIDNPKDVQWAESSAAPTFGRIMQFLLSYGKVQPTEPIDSK